MCVRVREIIVSTGARARASVLILLPFLCRPGGAEPTGSAVAQAALAAAPALRRASPLMTLLISMLSPVSRARACSTRVQLAVARAHTHTAHLTANARRRAGRGHRFDVRSIISVRSESWFRATSALLVRARAHASRLIRADKSAVARRALCLD